MEQNNQELELARNYALYTHRNIFLTGKAGTGKTTFLRRLKEESRKRMIVVAPTGVAAINAGGMTIHSFFQLSPGLFLPGKMVAGRDPKSRYSFSKQKVNVLRSLSLLVIDEISMVRADLLDAIDEVLRRYQDRNKPFGGVQLLLIGDLQQLAPVATESEWPLLSEFYETPYFFSSIALRQTDFVCIELRRVYRQQDERFVNLLNAVRENRLTTEVMQTLNQRYIPHFTPPKGEEWITLTTHNHQAAQLNNRCLEALDTPPQIFTAKITGDFPDTSYPTDAQLTLKVGAQVMFCKNDPSSAKAFYNGRIGRIEAINNEKVTVVCQHDRIEVGPLQWTNTRYATDSATGTIHEEIVGSFTQIPLRAAWAITIHKSQGLTFDHAIINAGRAFSHGQVYVALSRCRTIDGLVLATPITSSVITSDPDVIQFNGYAAEHQPSAETFLRDRRSFVEDILCDTFDFSRLSMRLRYFARLSAEHLATYFPSYARSVAATAAQTDTELLAVGVKFQQQIHQLIQMASSYSENTILRERVHKAMAYFASSTARILGEFFEIELPEIDNTRVREQIINEHTLLRNDYNEKMGIYVACINEFTLTAYWDAKARAAMTEDTTKKKRTPRQTRATRDTNTDAVRDNNTSSSISRHIRGTSSRSGKATIDYEHITNPTLYHHILEWRTAVARERHLPPAYIMPVRTVIGIANLCPCTLEDLLTIPGIGPKTANDYGPELLEIVQKNMKK
ncbi:MAG: AAA family ATPase [Bacteroidales bacterium]|nr:AAA family ATPase [Bacteroidales bacterium]